MHVIEIRGVGLGWKFGAVMRRNSCSLPRAMLYLDQNESDERDGIEEKLLAHWTLVMEVVFISVPLTTHM
jgi:hypothetical protein